MNLKVTVLDKTRFDTEQIHYKFKINTGIKRKKPNS